MTNWKTLRKELLKDPLFKVEYKKMKSQFIKTVARIKDKIK